MKFLLLSIFLTCTVLTSGQNETENLTLQMKKHLDAVSNKDLPTLQMTLSADSSMILILPQSKMTTTAKEFLDYHRSWFAAGDWTFETKILSTEVGTKLGMAIVEIIYREPERNGVPYYNKMIVSYDLRMEDGVWKVIKDQACSIEKSTDK